MCWIREVTRQHQCACWSQSFVRRTVASLGPLGRLGPLGPLVFNGDDMNNHSYHFSNPNIGRAVTSWESNFVRARGAVRFIAEVDMKLVVERHASLFRVAR